MMGDGIGFVPEKAIVAPFDGTVKTIFPTKHAIGLESDTGIEVLIHIGIDTVKLNGEGFESLVDVNEPVTQGQPLMKINLAYLKEHAPSVVTPVIITNQGDKTLTFDDVDSVDPGKRIMTLKISLGQHMCLRLVLWALRQIGLMSQILRLSNLRLFNLFLLLTQIVAKL